MQVIIVGAGPSGLVLALQLAKGGVQVKLLDSEDKVDDRPRAAHYGPAAIRELARAGILDDVRAEGFIPGNAFWRKIDRSILVEVHDSSQPKSPEALTVLPLGHLSRILMNHVNANPKIEVFWNHKVTDIGQDDQSAWAVVKLKDGSEKKVSGDYLCGCDGANSQVRRSLFGETAFPGKTWDAQIVATNVYYPLDKYGLTDINYIIHPTDYYMAAKITRDGMWRVSYGEDTKLNLEQVIANQPKKFKRILPGNPKPEDYKLLNCSPYRIHQRCAEKFRVGRVTIAADAAHLCNPFGGLGLTGGLIDVGGLADCLIGVATGRADDSILDKYSEERKRIYLDIIDKISSSNFRMISSDDPDKLVETDPAFQLFKRLPVDEQARKQFSESFYALGHDFTQYYNQPALKGNI